MNEQCACNNRHSHRTVLQAGAGIAAAGTLAPFNTLAAGAMPSMVGADTGHPDPQMQAVLDQLGALHTLPIPMLTPAQARQQCSAKPLDRATMMWFFKYYLRTPADGANPYVSSLRAPDLHGLPTTSVIMDQFDPLRSEGEAYARRLRNAGVRVRATGYNGVAQEFFMMSTVVAKARQAVTEAAMDLKSAIM